MARCGDETLFGGVLLIHRVDTIGFTGVTHHLIGRSLMSGVGAPVARRDDQSRQLTWIKYKVSTDELLRIEPKEDLKRRTGKSPDFAESFMLTFTPRGPMPNIR